MSILLRVILYGLNSKDGSILVLGSRENFIPNMLNFNAKLFGMMKSLVEMFTPKPPAQEVEQEIEVTPPLD